jgi:hypothetical protein
MPLKFKTDARSPLLPAAAPFSGTVLERGPGVSDFGNDRRREAFSVFFRPNLPASVRRSKICSSFERRFKLSD